MWLYNQITCQHCLYCYQKQLVLQSNRQPNNWLVFEWSISNRLGQQIYQSNSCISSLTKYLIINVFDDLSKYVEKLIKVVFLKKLLHYILNFDIIYCLYKKLYIVEISLNFQNSSRNAENFLIIIMKKKIALLTLIKKIIILLEQTLQLTVK